MGTRAVHVAEETTWVALGVRVTETETGVATSLAPSHVGVAQQGDVVLEQVSKKEYQKW
jgi:hypothetical protein